MWKNPFPWLKKTHPQKSGDPRLFCASTRCKGWQAEKSAMSVPSSTDIFKYTCNTNQSDATRLIEPAHSCVVDAETLNIPPHIPIFSCDLSRFSTKSPRYLLIKSATRDSKTIFYTCVNAAVVSESRVGLQPSHLNLATLSWLLEGKQQNWFSSYRRSVYYNSKKISRIKLEILTVIVHLPFRKILG